MNLKGSLEKLTVGGKPVFVQTAKERMRAYSYAATLKIKVKSRSPITGGGFNIHRVG